MIEFYVNKTWEHFFLDMQANKEMSFCFSEFSSLHTCCVYWQADRNLTRVPGVIDTTPVHQTEAAQKRK